VVLAAIEVSIAKAEVCDC